MKKTRGLVYCKPTRSCGVSYLKIEKVHIFVNSTKHVIARGKKPGCMSRKVFGRYMV